MRKHSAWLWMVALAILFMAIHFVLGWAAFQHDAATHGQTPQMAEYRLEWGRDTVENLQSEMWQLAVQFVVLAGVLKAIGLRAYEEDQEEIKQSLNRIEERVDDLDVRHDGARTPQAIAN